MLFNSYEFLFLFLPLFLFVYYAVCRTNGTRLFVLAVFSYVFYGWWDWRFTCLMLVSTVVDYVAGLRISRAGKQQTKRFWLLVSVLCNLSLLGFFKYWDFLAGTLNSLLFAWEPGLADIPLFNVLLPVGISFYTFQSMSYSIDIYRQDAKPAKNFISFASYVSMFPQLVAGPIVRYNEIATQLVVRTHTWHKAALGIRYFVLGLGKKVILADGAAALADAVFSGGGHGFTDSWVGVTAYAVQIYFDFSGYSDMAVGLGYMLGFKFPQNFNSPYKASSITDFWRRWHISLSTWLRDYLYIPLGGNRKGHSRTYMNLMITMLLGGLWHGASWNFVLWGLYHGLLLSAERVFGRYLTPRFLPLFVRRTLTFLLVLFGWVLFRASNLRAAIDVYAGLVGSKGGWRLTFSVHEFRYSFIALAVALVLVFCAKNSHELREHITWWTLLNTAVLFMVCVIVLLVNTSSPFLYFQF
jgi:alginate O-acetyltransferase complex protein AlgI